MLILGVLSVLQLVLLPGLLLIRLFKSQRSFLQNAAYVFMLSLLSNYVVIFLLVAAGLYRRSVVLVLFAAEVAALLWLNRKQLTHQLDLSFGAMRQRFTQGISDFREWQQRDFLPAALYFVFSVLAALSVLWLIAVFFRELTHVFNAWDAYASWDRWAVKWAQNRFPGDTWEYPQLIPVSFSLTYKFIGTTAVKFFAKSIMPLFSLMIVLMLVDLGRKEKSFGYMLGASLALYGLVHLLPSYIAEGYVDIPVASFSLMAVYTLLKARHSQSDKELRENLWLGALAAAAAAVTKQTGAYVAAFYPLLAFFWLLKDSPHYSRRESLGMLAKQIVLMLLIVVPWYALAEYQILIGGNASNIEYVTNDIYAGQTLPQRFLVALQSLGGYAYFFAFLLISLPVLDKRFRHIVIFLVFPFSILWALFLSYEYRNLAVALPLIGLASGKAVEGWVLGLHRIQWKRTGFPAYAGLLTLAGLLAIATIFASSDAIIQHQIKAQKQIFEPLINEQLYDYFNAQGGPELVISSYPVGWLPDLQDYWVKDLFTDYASYEEKLQNNPEGQLLLLRTDIVDPAIWAELQTGMDSGEVQEIFTQGNYIFLRIPPRNSGE